MTPRQPIVVLLRRVMAKPNQPRADTLLGRCEGAALAHAIELGSMMERPVVALAAGPAKREDHVLAIALRAGCDRAIRIDDKGFDDLDYLGTAEVLAPAARRLDAHLVLCGDRSEETLAGATGPAVAERLNWPHLSAVTELSVVQGALVVQRQTHESYDEFEIAPPAVVCVARAPMATSAAPSPSTPAIKEIEEWSLATLDLDPRLLVPRSRVESKVRPIRRAPGAIFSSPHELVARLRADRVLG